MADKKVEASFDKLVNWISLKSLNWKVVRVLVKVCLCARFAFEIERMERDRAGIRDEIRRSKMPGESF